MKKVIKSLLTLAVTLSLFSCTQVKHDKKLVVFTSSGYAPFEMIDPTGKLEGFDIDVMNYIAKDLGYTIEWKDVDFKGIIAGLQANQADVAIAGMTPTLERMKSVDFTDVYYGTDTGNRDYIVSTKKSNVTNVNGLVGKKVGSQLGTVQAELLQSVSKEYDIKVDLRDEYGALVQDLLVGRLDALIVEKAIGKKYLENNKELIMNVYDGTGAIESEGNAIALPKGSKHANEFNHVIQKMKDNGEMQKLVDKWFSE